MIPASCFLNSKCRTIYNMCTQKPPQDYSQQLYDKYREAFEEYIISTVRISRDPFFHLPPCFVLAIYNNFFFFCVS